MFVLIVILLFAAAPFFILLAFIAWDKHRLASQTVKPLPREALKDGWKPKPVANAHVFLGLAAMSATLGVAKWFSPDHPPYRGRLSWAYETAYDYFGLRGQAYVFLAFAAFLVIVALMAKKSES